MKKFGLQFSQKDSGQEGIIGWIILIIIAILILSYFGFSLRDLGDDPTTQDNFSFVIEWVRVVWEDYLSGPVTWIWENIIEFIWNDLFLANLERLKDGDSLGDLAPDPPQI